MHAHVAKPASHRTVPMTMCEMPRFADDLEMCCCRRRPRWREDVRQE
jgi:hypothetical protein